MAGDGIVTWVKVAQGVLRLRLALTRCSAGALVATVLVLVAAGLWLALLPSTSTQVDKQVRAVALARSAPLPKPVISAPALASERLTAFYTALGDGAHTEQVVINLFGAASDAGVELDKAEYKPAHDTAGRFDTYTITLPVKGDYSSLRRFSEKVLVSVPYASLDDMRFKRNSASDPAVEANLRFTAFLRPSVLTQVPVPVPVPVAVPVTASAPMASTAMPADSVASAVLPASGVASTPLVASAAVPASTPVAAPRASQSIPIPTLPLPTTFATARISTGEVRR